MRLLILTVVLTLGMPLTAFAQRAESPPRWTISPRHGPVSEGWPRNPPPRFTIPPRGTVGLPLPEIGLPLPRHGLPPLGWRHPQFDFGKHSRRYRPEYYPPFTYYPWPTVFYVPPEYFAPPPVPEPIQVPAVEQPAATGRLILDRQPEGAQVFVDGYYAGIPDDFSVVHGGGVVETGQHRIDISAPGYESLSIDVRIAANQSVTYRGTLPRIPPPAAKTAPVTFYLIPGCYMGNVPPKDARLPATCDLGRVVEFKY